MLSSQQYIVSASKQLVLMLPTIYFSFGCCTDINNLAISVYVYENSGRCRGVIKKVYSVPWFLNKSGVVCYLVKPTRVWVFCQVQNKLLLLRRGAEMNTNILSLFSSFSAETLYLAIATSIFECLCLSMFMFVDHYLLCGIVL